MLVLWNSLFFHTVFIKFSKGLQAEQPFQGTVGAPVYRGRGRGYTLDFHAHQVLKSKANHKKNHI